MVFQAIFAAITTAVKFVFTGQSLLASALRFIGGSIVSQLLAGQTKVEGPRLSDLKVQVSTYGNPIPRLYGERVRIAGNVIDKSDLIELRKRKKKKMLGITVASQTTYTYSVHLAVLIAEGQLPDDALVRIRANGKVIFDRDAPASTGGTPAGVGLGILFEQTDNTQAVFKNLTFYPGSATQPVDPLLQSLHPGDDVPAYRHSAYVVIEGLQLADWGNGIPNLEFEVETNYTTVRSAVEHLATFADVTLNAWPMRDTLRGYVVGRAGTVWSAIEPLSGMFSFDLITSGPDFRVRPRGDGMRIVLSEEDFAARPPTEGPRDLAEYMREDANTYPDEVTVTYLDTDRDQQPNTQRAFRNEGYSKNKIDVEVAVVLSADEARRAAGRIMSESIAAVGSVRLFLSERFRWLVAGDCVGVPIDGQVHPFRIGNVNQSPSGIVLVSGVFEDVLSYSQDVNGASGLIPPNELALPGDTIFQPIDSGILEDADDDSGFYIATTGTGGAWVGGDIYRAEGVGSPLTYEFITDIIVPASIGDCVTTLASGPVDVFDYVNTVDVQMLGGDDPESVTEADVLVRNANFAWIGDPDGQDGEYINFTTATPGGSPLTYTLSGLLRGRRGTEHAVGSHGSGERFVIMNTDEIGRLDFGAIDWNLTRTFRAVSIPMEVETGLVSTFENTGEGKRPYAPVFPTATRNGLNDDVLLGWTRRTRYETPAIGGGPVPLGEEVEAYEVDIYSTASPAVVVRTLTSATASVNYTEAMQTADGHPLGDPVTFTVFQMSGVRGRGHPCEATL